MCWLLSYGGDAWDSNFVRISERPSVGGDSALQSLGSPKITGGALRIALSVSLQGQWE
jgi:hypothetical protein